MAKNRRINNDPQTNPTLPIESPGLADAQPRLFSTATGQRVSALMLAAALVYVSYWPHDSVDVQQGGARYLVVWMLIASTISFLSYSSLHVRDYAIDLLAWCVPAWMTLSLVFHQETANLRLGINELGWWLATAAAISLARRVASDTHTAGALMRLIIALAFGVAVFGWHQSFIGIPHMIAEYKANPEAMLRQIGIVAEEGSAMRVVFENRLYDGGPTGTFALANSMAVMLLGGLIATVATAASSWRSSNALRRCVWCIVALITGGMLLAARSRASVLALVLIIGWYGLNRLILTFPAKRFHPRSAIFATTAILLFAIAGGTTLMVMFRNSEWFEQAPASIAIRLNYWRACFGMLQESPWFGVGPGQFKASYETFRAAASNEQIADPHQFLLQIATAGGWPALVFSLMLLASFMTSYLVTMRSAPVRPDESALNHSSLPSNHTSWVLIGTCLAMAMVWLLGAALAYLPVVDAALISTFVTVILSACLWYGSTIGFLNGVQLRAIAAYAVGAMGIALLASGGITVPGVSLIAWTLAGISVPASKQGCAEESGRSSQRFPWSRFGLGLGLLAGVSTILWYRTGVSPVDKANALQNQFEYRWSQGQIEPAIDALVEAGEQDRYDAQPWLQLAAVYRTLAVAQVDQRAKWERRWRQAEEQAIAKASLDPVVVKQLGDNWLIHYQRYGDQASLEKARELFTRAVALSPSHEAYAAQQAAILQALGEPGLSEIVAKAEELSRAGGYYERSLAFTLLYVPEKLGESVVNGPRQRPASEVLRGLLKHP